MSQREAKIQYSLKLPPNYDKVVTNALAYIKDKPNTIGKRRGEVIFLSDVFKWSLDMIADYLEIDLKNEANTELKFIEAETDKQETLLCSILSTKDFNFLNEYLFDGFKEDGMTVFEFCDHKNLDWQATIEKGDLVYKP